jgi:hypothetical protein
MRSINGHIAGTVVLLFCVFGAVASAQLCPCTIWAPYVAPVTADGGDPTGAELGLKFSADADGLVTGVRFYKSAANTGTHVGNLWSDTGTLLASAAFANESASGWQEADFGAPVAITGGSRYVVSYFAPNGHYAYDSNAFTTAGVDNAPLHALASGIDGPNGVYSYGTVSVFPTSSYNASNYWVDVVYSPAGTAQGPAVASMLPANGSAGVNTTTAITATFTKAIDPSTISSNSFQLSDPSNNVVAASVTYNSTTLTATLQPTISLLPLASYTAVLKGGNAVPTIRDLSGAAMAASVSWSFTTANAPGGCPCSIWGPATIPGTVDGGDSSPGEFGLRFRSDVNGFVIGARFYKSATNTGLHLANLWDNNGNLLGSAPFTNESSAGWQQVNFGTPIPIVAGTTYVVSYFTSAGHYSYDVSFFATQGVDNVPLHALADKVDGNNGIFAIGSASAFPASTFNSSNYWVDLVFNTVVNSNPPAVTSFSPANGASGVSTSTTVVATFNEVMDATTINTSTFRLLDASGNSVSCSLSYNPSTQTATLQPSSALSSATIYTAILVGAGIRNTSGTAMASSVTWSFGTTGGGQPPVVVAVSPSRGAANVSISTSVSATFGNTVDPTSLTSNDFQLFDASSNLVSATVTYSSATLTAFLQPSAALAYSMTYTAILRAGGVRDSSGAPLSANVVWNFTTAPAPPPPSTNCPCRIWSATTTPAVQDGGDTAPTEVGVRFQADTSGLILGVRFYKSSLNVGTHIGNLWSGAGVLLASATFTNESASGWQQVMFSSPVTITAGTTYVASYFAPAGHYAYDQYYFGTSGVNNSPLQALASGTIGNGVFVYNSSSSYPSQSYDATNYWVDVVYVQTNSTGAPKVITTTPVDGSSGVSAGTLVTIVFNEPMDPLTFTSGAFELTDSSNNVVLGTATYSASSANLVFTPTTVLSPLATYTATLRGTVTDASGHAMGNDLSWTFVTAAAPPNLGPGGPILVISSVQNPFTRYYNEILLNEGLNEYTVQDISTVTAATLNAYDVVILGDMSLTPTQVAMFTSWVTSGGRLIAMHPDKQLASLFGLTSTANTLSNAYLAVNNVQGPGVGIVGDSIQFHGSADLYTMSGATAIAYLYSSATAASANPAVTLMSVGAGQAAAFTYDLAKSVVYTRQGNPAWSGQQRNQFIDPTAGNNSLEIRSDDLYFGNAPFDPEPDWVDLTKVAIPQADEQQRLLLNLVSQMNATKKPLPHFWYFPSGFKAVVVMTGDDHNNGGTQGRFDQYVADSPSGCSVAGWTCVRSTSYIWTNTPIANYQSYAAEGFEIANHADNVPTCTNWTPASLDSAITQQLAAFAQNYPGLPAPRTNRTHCVLWSDFDSQPQILLNHGIRLDTSYYYWPAAWIQDRPGMFTGSGMPMRFADRNGNTIDVYQVTTQMPDESLQTFPMTINTLLDNAIGPNGFYGAFAANMHTDTVESPGSDSIVASAQSRGVPIISSLQMLNWLDGRNSSSFGSFSWDGSVLNFAVSAATAANNLQAMLPVNSTGGQLRSLSLNGNAVNFTGQTIKGLQYAAFPAATGTYKAVYGGGGSLVIAGTVSGPGGNGATVSLSGAATAIVVADSWGNYIITGLTNGSYVITASAPGYTFTPASQSVTLNGASVSGVNFSSVLTTTFSVSGNVAGAGGAFATMMLSSGAVVVADASGNFVFNGVIGGSYTITPAKSGYVYSPASANLTVAGANVTNVNFTSSVATATTVAIDTTVTSDVASASTSITSSAFSTTLGNELLLAFVGGDSTASDPPATVASVTGAGLTWQLVQRTNVQLGTAEIWRALAPAPLTNATLTANFATNAPETSSITVIAFSGVDFSGTNGSGGIGATASGSSGSGAPSATLVTTRNNSLVFGIGYDWDGAVARTPNTGQSLIHQFLSPDDDTIWVQRQNSPIPLAGTSVSISDSAPDTDRFDLSIVEILPIQPTYTISGNVSGAGGNGATLSVTGAATSTTTADAAGNFSLSGLRNGSYTVVPTQPGYSFTPATRIVVVNGANVSGVSFASTGVPIVSLSPASVAFGNQLVNTTSTASIVTLTNTGTASMTISSISLTGTNASNFARTTTCGSTLAANATCNISITFTPSAAGARTASLSTSDNAAGSPQTVALTGTGAAPAASLSPGSLAFGIQPINTTSSANVVTLTNTGNAAMTITSISLTGTNSSNFARTSTCGTTLAAGANCTISITFTPSTTGSKTASLSIADNASGSPQTVTLTGTGTAVSITPAGITFASQLINTTSAAQTVTLKNNGTTTLTGIATSITGANSADFARTTTCGSTLAAGVSCSISVTFKPTAGGARSATLGITDSDPTSPQQISLTGTAVSPVASLTPTSVAFGTQLMNTTSSASTVTLTNTGSAAMTISSTSLTGTNASNFAMTSTCGSSLGIGAKCTFSVTFKPSASGTRTASISITDNAPGSPHTVSLSGVGSGVTVSPTNVTFASQTVNTTSAAQTVTLKNIGTTTLTSLSISLTGTNTADFARTSTCGTTLSAGASCAISVTFKPLAVGSRSAVLRIANSDPTSPQQVTLAGTGK